MALIIENGSGVAGANAYVDAAYVTNYLTERSRETENNWGTSSVAQHDSAIIAATDYIEQRWRLRFKGVKQFSNISQARATLTFTAQPANGDVVTIGATTYTFNTVLGGAYSVLIDPAKLSQTIVNLVSAITGLTSALGVTIGVGTEMHPDVIAQSFYGFSLLVLSKEPGPDANFIVTTTTSGVASWNSAALTGGNDLIVAQPLSFPRGGLTDNDGVRIYGIPDRLKFAVAEYSVRALGAALLPDPTSDPSGRVVTKTSRKVGPIERSTEFESGAALSQIMKPYPAADRLLAEYILPAGGVFR